MMNSMEKHEMFRNMSQELFDSFKYMYNIGHTGVFENIAKVVKYAIAGLLAYISYTQFDTNTTISVLSGISAFCMAFRNRLIGIIPSIIGAIKMTKQVTSSKKGADDVSNLLEKICLKALKSSWVHDRYANHGYSDFCCDDENSDYVWMKKH